MLEIAGGIILAVVALEVIAALLNILLFKDEL